MVCAERRSLFDHKLEEVKPVDLIAAVRDRIEALNTQEQLDRLSDAVKENIRMFSPLFRILMSCPVTSTAESN